MTDILKVVRVEYQEQWLSIYSNVAMISECFEYIVEMSDVIFIPGIQLFADHLVATFVLPGVGFPIMVGPCETKREVRLAGIQYLIERTLQQALSITHPVMPVAETFYTCFASQISLLFASLWQAKVIET